MNRMLMKLRVTQRPLFAMLGAIFGLAGCSSAQPDQIGESEPTVHPEPAPEAKAFKPKNDARKSQAASRFKKSHPQAHVTPRGSRIKRLHGVMNTGSTADLAAENFRQTTAKDVGMDPLELVPVAPVAAAQKARPGASSASNVDASEGLGLMFNPATGTYKFRLYAYEQQRNGVAVYGGELRTLVRVDGENQVVWANPDLRPLGNFLYLLRLKRTR